MKNKGKFEDNVLDSTSEESQSEDDEDGCKLTEEVEKEFYTTLSKIKSKDPKIYRKDVEFFKDTPVPENKKKKSLKSNPLTLRDYERKLVVEKGGDISDEEPLAEKPDIIEEPTYVQEQELLKRSLKSIVNADSDGEGDEENWGGLFKQRSKNKNDQKEEEESYRQWLKGQKNVAEDEDVEKNMKSLRECWTNPGLSEEDKFLRDYVLNKKYLENDEEDKKYESSEDADEKSETEANSLSHRFEEPDQEYIKRYPRVMENSLRRKNDHRKLKREEVKERKRKEKQKKRAQVKEKQKQKRKEIEEKLEELKKITGNDRLAFDDILNKDFDTEEHEKAMERLFNDEFYSQEDPDFVPMDMGENVEEEKWNEEWTEDTTEQATEDFDDVNCEDPNFIMDCDYDPTQEKPKESTSRSRRRKDKHRRTTLSEAVTKEKPVFDPATHKTFQEYVDQYYGIDCEDFIGDLPCRFKYRNTVANSYGLSIEEILAADEKELERWCSIKRIHQLRPEFKEKGDLKVYQKKAADEQLKRKILPSLYKNEKTEAAEKKSEDEVNDEKSLQSKKKKKKKKTKVKTEKLNEPKPNYEDSKNFNKELSPKQNKLKRKQNEAKFKTEKLNEPKPNDADSKIVNKELNPKPNKLKRKQNEEVEVADNKKRRFNNKLENKNKRSTNQRNGSKSRKPTKQTEESSLSKMSDARLLAYGIKPKKFRNKLKYSKDGVK